MGKCSMQRPDSVLDLLQLRLRKLRASAGEDVLMADCMFELARRLYGRARYGEAEKLDRECLRIRLDLSFPRSYGHRFGFASRELVQYYFWDAFAPKQPKFYQSCDHLVSKASHGKCLENSKVH